MPAESMLRAALLVALMSVAPFALAEESDALGTMHDLSGNTTVLLLEKGSDASRGCKALDGGNVEVERERADHCCQNEAYCCGGKACASGSSQCGFRFVCNKRGWGGKAMHGEHEEHKDKGDAQHKDDGKHGVHGQHDGDHGKKAGDDRERNVKIIAGSVGGAVALIAIAVAVRCFCRCSKKPGAIQEIESARFSAPLEQLEGGKMQAWGEKPQRPGAVTGDIVGFVPGAKAPAALSSALTYGANYEYESKPGTATSAKTASGKAPAALTYVANYDYASTSNTPAPAGEASSSPQHHAAALSLDVPPGVLAARTTGHGGPVQ
jgi:hypothetical protein